MSDVEKTEFELPEGFAAKAPSPVDAHAQADEHDIERSLRPKSINEFIGQPKVRELSLIHI